VQRSILERAGVFLALPAVFNRRETARYYHRPVAMA
jgi:hypothetical protein